MANMFLDFTTETDILQDGVAKKELRDAFKKDIETVVLEKYKGNDASNLYSLFSDKQIVLMKEYYQGFSKEYYRELCGTVELQVQKRAEDSKNKVKELGDKLGEKIVLEDWEYNGMADGGQVGSYCCDLCNGRLRYVHFAYNKKSKQTLSFGQECASKFFETTKEDLNNLKSVQASLLKDIKIMAHIHSSGLLREYYENMCGFVGGEILSKGLDGILQLETFKFIFEEGVNYQSLTNSDNVGIEYSDGRKESRTYGWVKENIISCINADLNDDIYADLSSRYVVTYKPKKADKLNNALYIYYARAFYTMGLPIPLSICNKLNSIVKRTSASHNPDYIRYAEDLLMSHHLVKSPLLRKAFTDFIVNYFASANKCVERDEEMLYWGIRGAKTFYNTVLLWEMTVYRLQVMKDMDKLVKGKLLSEQELDNAIGRSYTNGYNRIKVYMEECMSVFWNNKKVLRDDTLVSQGFSKYMLDGVDRKIELSQGYKTNKISLKFSVDTIPHTVGYNYNAVKNAYKYVISREVKNTIRLLEALCTSKTEEEVLNVLTVEGMNKGKSLFLSNSYLYTSNVRDKTSEYGLKDISTILSEYAGNKYCISESKKKEILSQYSNQLMLLRSQAVELYKTIKMCNSNISVSTYTNTTRNTIQDDYEKLFNSENNNESNFKTYCDLLIGKRATNKVQSYLLREDFNLLRAFRIFENIEDLFIEIEKGINSVNFDKDNEKVRSVFSIDKVETAVGNINNLTLEEFARVYTSYLKSSPHYLFYKEAKYLRDLLNDSDFADETLYSLLDVNKFKELKDLIESNTEGIKNISGFRSYYVLLNRPKKSVVLDIDKNNMNMETFKSTLIGENRNVLVDNNTRNVNESDKYIFNFIRDLKGANSVVETLNTYVYNLLDDYAKKVEETEREVELKAKEDSLRKECKRLLESWSNFFNKPLEVCKEEYDNRGKSYSISDMSLRRQQLKGINYYNAREEYSIFRSAVSRVSRHYKVLEILQADVNNSVEGKRKETMYRHILRAECYTKGLIYTHSVGLKEMVALLQSELDTYEYDRLSEIKKHLSNYYVFRDNMTVLIDLSSSVGVSIPSSVLLDSTPVWPNKDMKTTDELLETVGFKADETGLCPNEKAYKLYSKDVKNIGSFEQSVVESVVKKGNCSEKQSVIINKAYARVFLGDTVNNDTTTSDNTSITVPADFNMFDVIGDSSEEDKVCAAIMLSKHIKFESLQDIKRKITQTVINNGTCSAKQWYHIASAIRSVK